MPPFLAILEIGWPHEGHARLGHIDRAVNLAIRPMGDGEMDVWRLPFAAFYPAGSE